jgi:probable rRNA maturation factor
MQENQLRLSIQYADSQHKTVITRARVRRCVTAALQADALPASVTVRFVNAAEARELNRGYRKKDYATNVLTFDYQHAPCEADIVICAPVIEQEAREQGKPLADHYAHMLVHGVLHAQGHDHERVRDAKRMEALEVEILHRLKIANPYQDG